MTKKDTERNVFADELFDTSEFEEIKLGDDKKNIDPDEGLFDKDIVDGFASEFDADEEQTKNQTLTDRETEFFQFLADTGKLDNKFVGGDSAAASDIAPGNNGTDVVSDADSDNFDTSVLDTSAFNTAAFSPQAAAAPGVTDQLNEFDTAPLGSAADPGSVGASPVSDETQVLSDLSGIDAAGNWNDDGGRYPDETAYLNMNAPDQTPEAVVDDFGSDQNVTPQPQPQDEKYDTAPLDNLFADAPETTSSESVVPPAESGRKNREKGTKQKKHKKSKRFKIIVSVIIICCIAVVSVLGYNAYQSAQRDANLLKTDSLPSSSDSSDSSSVIQPTVRDETTTQSSSSSSSSSSDTSSSSDKYSDSSSDSDYNNYYYDNSSDDSDYSDSDQTPTTDQTQSADQGGTTDSSGNSGSQGDTSGGTGDTGAAGTETTNGQ